MNPENTSRTIIGSVICVDLVGYSKKPVDRQAAVKEAFNKLLAQSLGGVAAEDRIILDTGDGAAITFLGDPEQCLAVGLELDRLCAASAARLGATAGDGPVRIGINLGPVRVAMDLNGYPKIIGDGINVAERIMSFAKPGQLSVSRSFHDMISRLSESHAALFRFEGMHEDKNGREHEVYLLERAAPASPSGPAASAAPAEGALVHFLRDKVKVGMAAGVLLAIIAGEAIVLSQRGKKDPPPTPVVASAPLAAPVEPAPAPTPEPAKPDGKAGAKAAAKPDAAKPAESAKAKAEPAKPEPAKGKADAKAEPPKAEPAKSAKEAPKPAAPEPAKSAKSDPKPEPAKAKADAKPEPAKGRADGKAGRRGDEPKKEEAPAPAPVVPVIEIPKEIPRPIEPAPAPAPAPAPPPVTVLSRTPLEFPRHAAAEGIDAGRVKARVRIDASGGVLGVQVLESRPPRVFDRAVVQNLSTWRFNAGADNRTYEVVLEFKR